MSVVSTYQQPRNGITVIGGPQFIIDERRLPAVGGGYLSGRYPDGITTVDGAPVAAIVRIIYRPESGSQSDGVVVAETASGADGAWRVDGLNPSLKFDVVGRKDGFNDVIMANVSPAVELP